MLNNTKTKIFVDCHVFDKGFQGTRTYIQGLYLELIKDSKKDFYLAAYDIKNLKQIFGEQDNLKYVKYYFKNPFIRLLFEIPGLIFKNKIDFAHFQYRVAPLKLCKYIVTTHDVLFEDFPEDFPRLNRIQSFLTYKFSAKISDIIFTVSEYSKIQIEKHLKVKNVVVMPNGIDDIFFEEYDKEKTILDVKKEYGISNYILYVSRWEPRKNHHLLLKSFVNQKIYENYHLVFIGDNTFKNKEFDTLFNSLEDKIKQKIICFKRVEFEKMILLLRGANVSVYPSRAEGFGIPPLESVAAKIPTICSNLTAMGDFDFFDNYFFNPTNQKDFDEKLSYVIENKDENLLQKREIIKQKYNWKIAAKIFNSQIEKFTDS